VAVSAETSSAAAGTTPVVGGAAAAFWALIAEPIPAKLADAAAKASGCVVTNDIGLPFDSCSIRLISVSRMGDPLCRLGFLFDLSGNVDSTPETAVNDPWSVE
jgi:hypothetical protein